jgi:hypothetical protein
MRSLPIGLAGLAVGNVSYMNNANKFTIVLSAKIQLFVFSAKFLCGISII